MTLRRHIALAVAALAVPVLLAACSAGSSGAASLPPVSSQAAAPSQSAPAYPPACPTSQPAPLPAGETRTVTITTDKGNIVIKVDGSLSPIAAGNFVALAECGFYDGTAFHRLVPGFVIQGGGRTDGPPYTIKDEPVTAPYVRGAVAMAKTANPDSADSQFFIALDDLTGKLDTVYQVFGNVTQGMDTVDTIAAMPNAGPPANAAVNPVTMTKVTVSKP